MRLFKGLFSKVDQLLASRRPIDEELFEELEELLIQADLSIHTTMKLMDSLRLAAKKEKLRDSEDIKVKLKELLIGILAGSNGGGLKPPAAKPAVYLFVRVNGVGKTTTISRSSH